MMCPSGEKSHPKLMLYSSILNKFLTGDIGSFMSPYPKRSRSKKQQHRRRVFPPNSLSTWSRKFAFSRVETRVAGRSGDSRARHPGHREERADIRPEWRYKSKHARVEEGEVRFAAGRTSRIFEDRARRTISQDHPGADRSASAPQLSLPAPSAAAVR